MRIYNSAVATKPYNYNQKQSKLAFGSNETKFLTDVLADIDIGKNIIALKEIDILPNVCFDNELIKKCIEIIEVIKKPLLESKIPEKFNKEYYNAEEAEKLNSVSKRAVHYVTDHTNKGFMAKTLQNSLKLDMEEAVYSGDSNDFFRYCFTHVVNNIRMLQRTLGVPDNYHLKSTSDIANAKGNLNELI